MDKVLYVCAISERKCEGICPESRLKRGQENICPAIYQKVVVPKKEKPNYNDDDLME